MFNSSIPYTMPVAPVNGNGGDGLFGGNGSWAWFLIILVLLGFNGNRGFGGFGGGYGSGAADNYVLASDFATIQRQLSDGFGAQERRTDAIVNGICDLGYTQQSLANATNMAMMSGFNATQSQLASCCCDIREGVQANTTQGVMNTNTLSRQIADCCCENEKMLMQNKFDAAQANCATLQAIDKVGDRIIDYLANEKTQNLRDENFALRLKASQEAQNSYLVSQLGYQCPKPAYVVQPPQSVTFPSTCGCNGNGNFVGFNNGFGYGLGTTIA